MKNKLKVEVEVWDIKVTEDTKGDNYGYYSFNYSIKINGKKRLGEYDSDWNNQTRAHFRRVLSNGEAARIVLGNEFY